MASGIIWIGQKQSFVIKGAEVFNNIVDDQRKAFYIKIEIMYSGATGNK